MCAETLANRGFDPESSGEVSVVLVNAGIIRELNLKFRDIDHPTDVLSFEIDGPRGEMVGEIVICPEYASAEVGVEELVVHGTLHLCGMDHGEDFEASEMAEAQREIMRLVRGTET